MMKVLKNIYDKLFGIDDTPQKIAIGVGLGVFFGVMPAMGPLIAVFFAILFRVNRAAALLGSLLTNTWLSIPAFFAAVVVGDVMTGLSYKDIANAWSTLWKNFSWRTLFTFSIYDVIFPVLVGYMVVSSILALLAYAGTLAILHYVKRNARN